MERRYPLFADTFASSTDFYNAGADSSSEEEANSSGDEIEKDFNHGTRDESDSDSFEKEMEMELNAQFSLYSQHLFDAKTQNTGKPFNESKEAEQNNGKEDSKMESEKPRDTYDEIYFSSGSDDDEDNVGGVSSKSQERRTMKTDDELLYDPYMDDEDEKWVKEQRKEYHMESTILDAKSVDEGGSEFQTKAKNNSTKNLASDAILSCPACLTTLCIDCQRHDIYKQQFRAMFVMNCKVMADETLRYEAKKKKKKQSKKTKEQSAEVHLEQSELYNPVRCTSCKTEVAVFDKDEVYHFFNVVESLP